MNQTRNQYEREEVLKVAGLWYRNAKLVRSLALVCLIIVLLNACMSNPKIEPIATTYPAKKSKEVTNVINLPIPISAKLGVGLTGGSKDKTTNEKIEYSPGVPAIQSIFKKTVTGDSAEKELWIVPRNSAEVNEVQLLARLDEGGKKACKGSFLLKDTKYYFGTEGTLKFVGIKSPAVSAVYRCPAKRLPVDDPDFQKVEKYSKKFKDHNYFDISSFLIPHPSNRVLEAVRAAIEQRGLKISMDKPESSTHIIIASGETRGTGGSVPEHLVVVARENSIGAKISMMLMRYQNTSHERGVRAAGTNRPGFSREARPFARNTAYLYSRIFAEQVSKLAGK